jgi:ADP-ribose pyrophosphatase
LAGQEMNEKTVDRKTVFSGRVLSLEVHRVELDSGREADREIVRHDGAIAAVAFVPGKGYLFVRQFRKAVEQVVLEVVAGCLGKGEAPADCAARELLEETGYGARSLMALGSIWPTPGYSDEVIHLFYAEMESEGKAASPDEDELLEVVFLDGDEVDRMIERREIRDGKTMLAWTLAASARGARTGTESNK